MDAARQLCYRLASTVVAKFRFIGEVAIVKKRVFVAFDEATNAKSAVAEQKCRASAQSSGKKRLLHALSDGHS